MRIITIGREFGSGGRELGKRLADELGIPCYDKEVIAEVAKLRGVDPEHIDEITEAEIHSVYPFTVSRTLLTPIYFHDAAVDNLTAREEVVKKLASQGDCVIVGRFADIILRDKKPLNLFVYAEKESKLKRCLSRASEGETEKSVKKKMKKIDRARARNYKLFSGKKWGDKKNYHLCINTTGMEIKSLVSALAAYAKAWFEKE